MGISHIISQISRFMLSKPQISFWLDVKLGQLTAKVRRYIDIDILNVDKWALVKLSAKSHVSCCPNLKYLFWLVIIYLVSSQLVFICNLPLPSWAQLSVWNSDSECQALALNLALNESSRRMFFNSPSQFSERTKKTVNSQLELLFLKTSLI